MDLSRLGLIYDGGGFAGIRSVGFYKAVAEAMEKKLIPREVYRQGVSVGALNCAEEDIRKLIETWMMVEREGPKKIFPATDAAWHLASHQNCLYSNRGLRFLVRHIDCEKVVRSGIKTEIITRNESRCAPHVFSNHDPWIQEDPERLREIILASTSIRGIFPPVRIQNEIHSDGISFMLSRAIQFGCTTIFLFSNSTPQPTLTENDPWEKRLADGIHDLSTIICQNDLTQTIAINRDLEILARKIENAPLAALFVGAKQTIKNLLSQLLFDRDTENPGFSFEDRRVVPVIVFEETAASRETLNALDFKDGDLREELERCYEIGKKILSENIQ